MSTATLSTGQSAAEAMSQAWSLCDLGHYVAAAAIARAEIELALRQALQLPWRTGDRYGTASLLRAAREGDFIPSCTEKRVLGSVTDLSAVIHGKPVDKRATEEAIGEAERLMRRLLDDLSKASPKRQPKRPSPARRVTLVRARAVREGVA